MLVFTDGKANKFWRYDIKSSSSKWSVTTHWGRIGLIGQSKTKTFGSSYSAEQYANDKMAEKNRKGYREATDEEFEMLKLQADVVGRFNKVGDICWLKRSNRKGWYDKVENTDIFTNPNIVPHLRVEIWIRTKDGAQPVELLFTADDYKIVETADADVTRASMRDSFVDTFHLKERKKLPDGVTREKFEEVAEKAKEVIGMVLARQATPEETPQ